MFCKKQSITPKDIYNRFRNKKRNSFIMKKNYLLAAILCLITTTAAAQQTEQVQIPNIPLASKWLYDNNGDGKLEFINPETKYVSNDKYNHSLKTYSHTGTEISSYTFPFTLRIDNIENNFIGLGNYVGDENIDMFFKGVYYSIYDTYLFTGNTGGTFTPSIIKKPAYVGTDYNKSTEWEMPDITLDADGPTCTATTAIPNNITLCSSSRTARLCAKPSAYLPTRKKSMMPLLPKEMLLS